MSKRSGSPSGRAGPSAQRAQLLSHSSTPPAADGTPPGSQNPVLVLVETRAHTAPEVSRAMQTAVPPTRGPVELIPSPDNRGTCSFILDLNHAHCTFTSSLPNPPPINLGTNAPAPVARRACACSPVAFGPMACHPLLCLRADGTAILCRMNIIMNNVIPPPCLNE